MSLNTAIHLVLHVVYFVIAALVGLFGYMPQWLRESLEVQEGMGDIGLFIFLYIFFIVVETIVENTVLSEFEPVKLAKDMLQNVIAGFLALGIFLVAGYIIGNAITNTFFNYLVALIIFVVANWVCRVIMCVLVKKLSTPRKRQVIK